MMRLPSRSPEDRQMAVSLPDARELSDEVLEALRLRALHGCECGFTETDVADLLGVCRETVCHWWSAYVHGGLDALPHERSGRPIGSGRALSDARAERIQLLLRTHQPGELGVAAPLWSRRAVADLIRREFAVELAVRTVGLYLRRWGFTPKRPRRHARDQDPEEVRRRLGEVYPAIERRAEREGAVIYRADEVGAAADRHPARGYTPEGEPATMDVPGPHVRANQISAVANDGKVRFMTYTGSMTAALFLAFLGRLLWGTTGKVFLIVDRLRAHMTPGVTAWVAAQSGPAGGVLPAAVRAGAEPGRVPEQRLEGTGERSRPPARQDGGAFADPAIHAPAAAPPAAGHELLSPSGGPICRQHQCVNMLLAGVIKAKAIEDVIGR